MRRFSKRSIVIVIAVLATMLITRDRIAVLGPSVVQAAQTDTLPLVSLYNPENDDPFKPGEAINIVSSSVGAEGILGIELLVDGKVKMISPNPNPQADQPYLVNQTLEFEEVGLHTIQVRAYTTSGLRGESEIRSVRIIGVAESATSSTPTSAPLAPTVTPTLPYPYLVVRSANGLTVWLQPSTQSQAVDNFDLDDVVPILGQYSGAGSWWQVSASNAPNSIGWVLADAKFSTAYNTEQVRQVTIPATATPSPNYPYLTVKSVSGMVVYGEPRLGSQQYGTVPQGETRPILGRYQTSGLSWWQVSHLDAPSGIGWVLVNARQTSVTNERLIREALPLRPLATPSPTAIATSMPAPPALSAYLVTTAEQLIVRAGPSTDYFQVGQLTAGQQARIVGRANIGDSNWWQIIDPQGWVLANPDLSVAYNTETIGRVPLPVSIAPTATPIRLQPQTPLTTIEFTVNRSSLRVGECALFYWNTSHVRAVYFQGRGVVGIQQTQLECPAVSTTYELRVVNLDGSNEFKYLSIDVQGNTNHQTSRLDNYQAIDFDGNYISDNDDADHDFWYDGHDFAVWNDNDNLSLAIGRDDSDDDDMDALSYNNCRDLLTARNRDSIRAEARRIACFRTDAGRIGKLRFERVSPDRVRIRWFLW